MEYDQLVQMGLSPDEDLQLIFRKENNATESDETVSLVYATLSKLAADAKYKELKQNNQERTYVIYTIPLNTDLNSLGDIELSINRKH